MAPAPPDAAPPGRGFSLDVPIPRDPDAVARWWVDFPASYQARHPREQPYRIETLERTPERIEVWTWWRMFGLRFRFRETIQVRGPRAFDANIAMGPFEDADAFRMLPDGRGGTVVKIHTVVHGAGLGGRLLAPLMAPMLHRWMTRIWADAARLCDAELGAAAGAPKGKAASRQPPASWEAPPFQPRRG